MRKLSKLTLDQLVKEMPVLSEIEMRNTIGGNSHGDLNNLAFSIRIYSDGTVYTYDPSSSEGRIRSITLTVSKHIRPSDANYDVLERDNIILHYDIFCWVYRAKKRLHPYYYECSLLLFILVDITILL